MAKKTNRSKRGTKGPDLDAIDIPFVEGLRRVNTFTTGDDVTINIGGEKHAATVIIVVGKDNYIVNVEMDGGSRKIKTNGTSLSPVRKKKEK